MVLFDSDGNMDGVFRGIRLKGISAGRDKTDMNMNECPLSWFLNMEYTYKKDKDLPQIRLRPSYCHHNVQTSIGAPEAFS